MKICKKCGAVNSDDNVSCADCSERLPSKLSADEEAKIRAKTEKYIDRKAPEGDPFVPNLFDKILGIFSLLAGIFSLCMLISAFFEGKETYIILIAALSFAVSFIISFFPGLLWALEQLRLGFTVSNAYETSPSTWWMTARRISAAVFAFSGVVLVVLYFIV